MARPRRVQSDGAPPAGAQNPGAPPAGAVRVRFSRVWSGDRGYFAPGAVAELPAEIAEGLLSEKVVEIVDEE